MKSLVEYIAESSAINKYGVLLDYVELKKISDLNKLTSLLRDGLEQANSRYKVLRIEAIEQLNKKTQSWNDAQLKKALANQEKKVIAYMKTKPGIMKRSEEKRQKYIDDKLEKFKSTFKGASLAAVEYDEKDLRFSWHADVHSEHSVTRLDYDIDTVAKKVAEDIDNKRKDSTWSHLIGISISVDNNELTNQWSPTFHIIPMFDEETEKTLSKEVRRFADFMTQQYDSGDYMGD